MQSIRHGLIPAVLAAAMVGPAWLLSSCADDRSSGMILTGDGRLFSDSASNTRQLAQENIDHDLKRYLGANWRSRTTVAQLPEWLDDHGMDADWRWTRCDVTITLIGDGQSTAPPIPIADIRDGVREYLQGRVERPRRNLTIAVLVSVDPVRFAQLGHVGSAPAPATTPAAEPTVVAAFAPAPAATPTAVPSPAPMQLGVQAYTIQAGDTLGEISAVFYGSTRYWRKIVQANPTCDPTNLRVGQLLIIPALNEPASAPPSVPPAADKPAGGGDAPQHDASAAGGVAPAAKPAPDAPPVVPAPVATPPSP